MHYAFQSALGEKEPYKTPRFDHIIFAKVTNITEYVTKRRIEVQLFNGSLFGGVPVPATLAENAIDVEPAEGDLVLLTYANGYKNIPVAIAFVKDQYAACGLLRLSKDKFSIYSGTGDKSSFKELIRVSGGVVEILYDDEPLIRVQDGLVTINGTVALGVIANVEAMLNNHESRIQALEELL